MPIYEYECEKCSLRFELKRRFSDRGSGFCAKCGSEARRVFSPVPIIFKGPGFYVTDNRSRQPSDEGEACKDRAGTKLEGKWASRKALRSVSKCKFWGRPSDLLG